MFCSDAILLGMSDAQATPLSGRRAQAARNDERILASARAVFIDDPGAPIAAVAKHAGVGISALYGRYASKEELLRKLAGDGLQRFIDEVEAALADDRDPWTAFSDFMKAAVDADTNSLTLALAGTFTPTPDMYANANRSAELFGRLFARIDEAGVLRDGLTDQDVLITFQMVAAIRHSDPARQRELRHRYLALLLEAMKAPGDGPLPGAPPTWAEMNERWSPRDR
jgi:AcrR family transcriptional regulator